MTRAQHPVAADTRDWFSPLGDSVLAAMRRREVTASEVSENLTGGLADLRRILSGQLDIEEPTAEMFARKLGGSAAFWMRRQEAFLAGVSKSVSALEETDQQVWLEQVPMPTKIGRGRMTPERRTAELKRRLRFYGVSSLGAWHARFGRDREATRFRSSQSFTSDEGALSLWLRCGEVEAALVDTAKWNADLLQGLLPELRTLSRYSQPEVFVPKLRVELAKAGVALVFVKSPKGCSASGASRMIAADKAMLLVSFRYRSDDQFWFTIFHELGHLILHGAQSFVDTADYDDGDDPREREANEFAERQIVPSEFATEFESLQPDYKPIVAFARKVGVCPGLILGQLQHRDPALFTRSSRLQRTWKWSEIEAAFAVD